MGGEGQEQVKGMKQSRRHEWLRAGEGNETIKESGNTEKKQWRHRTGHYRIFLKRLYLPDRVQEELSRVIGGRQSKMEDRKNLPYTDAVIHETQRLGNIVPMSLPHQTSQDVTFQGHFIEKVRLISKVWRHGGNN